LPTGTSWRRSSEYDFFGPKVGFDVFRFENGEIVEHWDNYAKGEQKFGI
jgi:predicted SnoaL-like aldol condensation-catalyzing enzyme